MNKEPGSGLAEFNRIHGLFIAASALLISFLMSNTFHLHRTKVLGFGLLMPSLLLYIARNVIQKKLVSLTLILATAVHLIAVIFVAPDDNIPGAAFMFAGLIDFSVFYLIMERVARI